MIVTLFNGKVLCNKNQGSTDNENSKSVQKKVSGFVKLALGLNI